LRYVPDKSRLSNNEDGVERDCPKQEFEDGWFREPVFDVIDPDQLFGVNVHREAVSPKNDFLVFGSSTTHDDDDDDVRMI
jgi:hypothetical protein